MRALLSRYRLSYLRNLAYMLQATEYRPLQYLSWYWRTKNFDTVAVRRSLVLTLKARLILYGLRVLGIIGLTVVVALAYQGMTQNHPSLLIIAGSVLVLLPIVIAHIVLVPVVVGRVLIQVPYERKLAARTKQQLAKHPALKIAIAGSYGKTTFKENLRTVLSTAKKVAATPGNYNTPIGISRFLETLTGDEEVLIFEFGESQPGDVRYLAEIVNPEIGVITGVSEAHLEQFGTLEKAAQTIFELSDYLGEKPIYVNAESKPAQPLTKPNHIKYSRAGAGNWKAHNAITSLAGTAFTTQSGQKTVHAETGLLGLHQVGPLSAAIAIADQLGVSSRDIEKGLAEIKPFEHRLQPLQTGGSIVTIDDGYNGNPAGAAAAVAFLKELNGKRRIYVTPGFIEAGARAEAVHEALGGQLANSVDVVILIRNSVTGFIADGLEKANFRGKLIWYANAPQAFASIPSLLKSGDVVLYQNDWPDNYA